MKIAWLSPLPPVRSGIASYSMMLLPEIAKLAEVTAVVDQPETDSGGICRVIGVEEFRRERGAFDVVVCQVGNNIHHEFVWREAREHPSVLVLHELVLHHLVTEATLAQGDSESYVSLMAESEGDAGKAFARGRAAGLHFEEGNFLFPGSSSLAAASSAIIVHNQWSRDRLMASGVTTPIRVIDHPLDQLKIGAGEGGNLVRQEHGFPEQSRVIGMFGFVTQPKRPQVVFEAFSRAYRSNPELRLLVVGQAAPNIDLPALARRLEVPDEAWSSTGWTSDRQFDEAIMAVDRVVSLRYPSAGESSGAIVRVFAAGKPVAVSDYAQFSELPDEVVVKIPLGDLEISRLEQFMIAQFEDERVGALQKRWIAAHGDPAVVAREYLSVMEEARHSPPRRSERKLPSHLSSLGVMPALGVDSFIAERTGTTVSIAATISNRGSSMIRSLDWGGPAYRMIVKLMAEGREITSAWWTLPGDLAPGESVTLSGSVRGRGGDEVALVHGWVNAPLADETPFFTGRVTE